MGKNRGKRAILEETTIHLLGGGGGGIVYFFYNFSELKTRLLGCGHNITTIIRI
jgi:hypothetical protein